MRDSRPPNIATTNSFFETRLHHVLESRESADPLLPLKFGAEVRNCMWRFVLCRKTSAFIICV